MFTVPALNGPTPKMQMTIHIPQHSARRAMLDGDGTVTDNNTGLMWQREMDDKMSWNDAVTYAENSTLAGYDD